MAIDKRKIITSDFNLQAGMIDLGIGQPSMSLLPLLAMAQAAEHCLGQNNPYILAYGAEQGNWYFRSALAGFLSKAYQYSVDPDHLFTTAGASQGLDFICRLFTQPGDTIFVETPTYSLALEIFADHRLNVVGLPMDQDGVAIDALEERLSHERPAFFYTIPTFHNPSSCTLAEARREALIQLSRDSEFMIVADEVYHLLSYKTTPPPPLAKYSDFKTVLSLGSFSKILAPGLRLGWIQTHPDLIEKLVGNGLINSGGGLNPFTSAIVQSIIELDLQTHHLSYLKREYSQRMKALNSALRENLGDIVSFVEPDGGFFVWLRLPEDRDAEKLLPKAKQHDVAFAPGKSFSPGREFGNYMRLSFAYYETSDLTEAVKRLTAVIQR
jgi:DNA-binding transcriptional MocR family regulator